MKVVAISACLMGQNCRYNGEIKRDDTLLALLKDTKLIPFCPEDACYGTPRDSMDLVEISPSEIRALSNATGLDFTEPIQEYADKFFTDNPDIDIYIGKDRSPSCGVKSAKLYDKNKKLISDTATGIMSKMALEKIDNVIDAEDYVGGVC